MMRRRWDWAKEVHPSPVSKVPPLLGWGLWSACQRRRCPVREILLLKRFVLFLKFRSSSRFSSSSHYSSHLDYVPFSKIRMQRTVTVMILKRWKQFQKLFEFYSNWNRWNSSQKWWRRLTKLMWPSAPLRVSASRSSLEKRRTTSPPAGFFFNKIFGEKRKHDLNDLSPCSISMLEAEEGREGKQVHFLF